MICNGMPASGVKVKLYDDDSGPDLDDLMDETTTDNQGFFSVSGHTDELTTIDPKINVYHDCNDGLKVRGVEGLHSYLCTISVNYFPSPIHPSNMAIFSPAKGNSRSRSRRVTLTPAVSRLEHLTPA
jgi:hypothetical protein